LAALALINIVLSNSLLIIRWVYLNKNTYSKVFLEKTVDRIPKADTIQFDPFDRLSIFNIDCVALLIGICIS
jgi:hypothetical protein